MALGDNANNNQDKKNYSPMVYSAYGMGNSTSVVDATKLSPSFSNGMLKLTISPLKDTGNPEQIEWDHQNGISVYLTHTKARLLLNEVCLFEQDPKAYTNLGVPSGSGLISICNGKELGATGTFIIIRKLNQEDGSVESSFAYQLKEDYHYSIRNFESKTSDFDKVYHNSLELEQLKALLSSYVEAMTGAGAYSVVDNLKYDVSRLNTKITAVAEKLGVETNSGYKSNKSSNSIFNNKTPRNFSSGSIDDIANQIG